MLEYLLSFIILIVILIAAYYTTVFVAKASGGSGRSKYMQVVDRLVIDKNTSIVIVDIDGTYQVLVIGENKIENLGVVDSLSEIPVEKKDFQDSFIKALSKKGLKNEE